MSTTIPRTDGAPPLIGGIEAGGTKLVCAVGRDPARPLEVERLPTTDPAETLGCVVACFRAAERRHGEVASFGVASFGPLDLDPTSPEWGRLTRTPKPGWSGTDLVSPLREAFGKPVAIDTDVAGAGLAEAAFGAGRGASSLVYLTVGTGIGGAFVRDGEALRGLGHPEMGHLAARRHPDDHGFAGVCPFHGDCLEGLASGTAIRARWGRSLEELGPEHPASDLVGFYLGQLAAAVTWMLTPHLVVMGGGVMANPGLHERVRAHLRRLLAGYPAHPRLDADLDRYLVAPELGDRAGVVGALLLARRALAGSRETRREPSQMPLRGTR